MNLASMLLDLSDNVYGRTSRRLEGLTDEELLWEPAPRSWSVRERPDGSVRADWAPYIGDADVTASGVIVSTRTGGDARRPPPLTNIAWRMWHLVEVYGRRQNEAMLTGAASAVGGQALPRRSAGAAIADLAVAHERWRNTLASLREDQFDEPIAHARRRASLSKLSKGGYVLAMIDEFAHHGAEIGLLRDLYSQLNRPDPLEEDPPNLAKVAWDGLWHLVRDLVEDGADVNAESGGATALHLACAAGEREIVELLLVHGADADAQHPLSVVWGGSRRPNDRGNVVDWAEHFGHADIADIIRSHIARRPTT